MSKTPDFLVNPSPTFFRWARAQKNLSVDELSNKTEIPAQLIHELENDHSNKALPYCELVDIAEKYQHPIAAFFRRKTPPLKTTPPDRRSTTTDGLSLQARESIAVARRLQYFAEQALLEIGETQPTIQLPPGLAMNPRDVAQFIRGKMGVTIEMQTSWPNEGIAFKEWRRVVETLGLFVFHIKLPTNELRAFSFNDTPICIVIGTNDSSTGKTFSLFHELGHVVRRQSGLCNPFKEGVSSQTIEGWCNMFAGELLMPIELMELEGSTLRQLNGTDERTQSQIARIAKKFKVSRYALLTRALVLDWIKQRQYDLLVETMGLSIPGKDFGRAHPDAVSAKRCLSKCGVRLVSLVLYGMQKGIINIGSASDYLGTKPENLSNLRRLVGSL